MNKIKGLIIKDLLQLKGYKRTLMVFMIIFILTAITQKSKTEISSMLVIMLTLGLGMFSMATFNYDEMSKADRYILTLPLTKKEVVIAKYVLIISSTIIGSIGGILISIVISLIMKQNIANIMDFVTLGLGGILGIGIVEAIQIPCVYKWGAEKGRIQVFIVTAVVAFVLGGIFHMVEKVNINLPFHNMLDLINQFLPIILIVSIVIVNVISYKITYKIYTKKEV